MKQLLLPYITLILLPLLVYFPLFQHDFTYFDDQQLIIDVQPYLTNPANLIQTFREPLFSQTYHHATLYRPLLNVSLILNTLLLGTPAPAYLTINLLLHLTTTLILYHFLKSHLPTPNTRPAILLALLFALHPINLPTIAIIPNRADLLLGLFALLSLTQLHHYLNHPHPRHLTIHLISLTLALFSKETALLLPIIFLIYYHLKQKPHLKLYLAYLTLTILFLLLRHQAFTNHSDYSLIFRLIGLLTNSPGLLLYLGQTLIPLQLSPLANLTDHHLWFGLITLLIPIPIILKKYSHHPLLKWSLMSFILLLIPTLINIDPGEQFLLFYEHRLYLPLLILTPGLIPLFNSTSKLTKYLPLLLLTIYITIIINKLPHYQNDLAFWQYAVRTAPSSATGHINLAAAYTRRQDWPSATTHYQQAINHHPQSMTAYAGLAHLHYQQQQYFPAIQLLHQQHQYRTSAQTLHLLALAYHQTHQPELTLNTLHQAHTADPQHLPTLIMLTQIYFNQGQLESALPYYLQAKNQSHEFETAITQALESYQQIRTQL